MDNLSTFSRRYSQLFAYLHVNLKEPSEGRRLGLFFRNCFELLVEAYSYRCRSLSSTMMISYTWATSP